MTAKEALFQEMGWAEDATPLNDIPTEDGIMDWLGKIGGGSKKTPSGALLSVSPSPKSNPMLSPEEELKKHDRSSHPDGYKGGRCRIRGKLAEKGFDVRGYDTKVNNFTAPEDYDYNAEHEEENKEGEESVAETEVKEPEEKKTSEVLPTPEKVSVAGRDIEVQNQDQAAALALMKEVLETPNVSQEVLDKVKAQLDALEAQTMQQHPWGKPITDEEYDALKNDPNFQAAREEWKRQLMMGGEYDMSHLTPDSASARLFNELVDELGAEGQKIIDNTPSAGEAPAVSEEPKPTAEPESPAEVQKEETPTPKEPEAEEIIDIEFDKPEAPAETTAAPEKSPTSESLASSTTDPKSTPTPILRERPGLMERIKSRVGRFLDAIEAKLAQLSGETEPLEKVLDKWEQNPNVSKDRSEVRENLKKDMEDNVIHSASYYVGEQIDKLLASEEVEPEIKGILNSIKQNLSNWDISDEQLRKEYQYYHTMKEKYGLDEILRGEGDTGTQEAYSPEKLTIFDKKYTGPIAGNDLLDPPSDKVRQEEMIKSAAETISERFTIHGIEIGELKSASEGPSQVVLTFAIPKDFKLSSATSADTIAALSQGLGVPVQDVKLGDEADTLKVTFASPKPREVRMADIINSDEWKSKSKDMAIPNAVGIDAEGNIVVKDAAEAPHEKVFGATKSGKSVYLQAKIAAPKLVKTPQQWKQILVDPKKLEFNSEVGSPYNWCPVQFTAQGTANMLQRLVQEMEDRASKLGVNLKAYNELTGEGDINPNASKNLQSYNKNHPGEEVPYISLVIDEVHALTKDPTYGPQIIDSLDQLLAKARAVGINITLATQRGDVESLPGRLQANAPAVTEFRGAPNDAKASKAAKGLKNPGDFIHTDQKGETITGRGIYLKDHEIRNINDFYKSNAAATGEEPPAAAESAQEPTSVGKETAEQAAERIGGSDAEKAALKKVAERIAGGNIGPMRVPAANADKVKALLESQGVGFTEEKGADGKVTITPKPKEQTSGISTQGSESSSVTLEQYLNHQNSSPSSGNQREHLAKGREIWKAFSKEHNKSVSIPDFSDKSDSVPSMKPEDIQNITTEVEGLANELAKINKDIKSRPNYDPEEPKLNQVSQEEKAKIEALQKKLFEKQQAYNEAKYPSSDRQKAIASFLVDNALCDIPTQKGDSLVKIGEAGGRDMVVLNINGHRIPFYRSTGLGGKIDVESGKWYPFLGMAERGAWLNKTSGSDIASYYESPQLREIANALDKKYPVTNDRKNVPPLDRNAVTAEINSTLPALPADSEDQSDVNDITSKNRDYIKSVADGISKGTTSEIQSAAESTEKATGNNEKVSDAPDGTTIANAPESDAGGTPEAGGLNDDNPEKGDTTAPQTTEQNPYLSQEELSNIQDEDEKAELSFYSGKLQEAFNNKRAAVTKGDEKAIDAANAEIGRRLAKVNELRENSGLPVLNERGKRPMPEPNATPAEEDVAGEENAAGVQGSKQPETTENSYWDEKDTENIKSRFIRQELKDNADDLNAAIQEYDGAQDASSRKKAYSKIEKIIASDNKLRDKLKIRQRDDEGNLVNASEEQEKTAEEPQQETPQEAGEKPGEEKGSEPPEDGESNGGEEGGESSTTGSGIPKPPRNPDYPVDAGEVSAENNEEKNENPSDVSLISSTPEEIQQEKDKIKQRDTIARRQQSPLKGGKDDGANTPLGSQGVVRQMDLFEQQQPAEQQKDAETSVEKSQTEQAQTSENIERNKVGQKPSESTQEAQGSSESGEQDLEPSSAPSEQTEVPQLPEVDNHIKSAIQKAGLQESVAKEIQDADNVKAVIQKLNEAKEKNGENSDEYKKALRQMKSTVTRMANAIKGREEETDVIKEPDLGTSNNRQENDSSKDTSAKTNNEDQPEERSESSENNINQEESKPLAEMSAEEIQSAIDNLDKDGKMEPADYKKALKPLKEELKKRQTDLKKVENKANNSPASAPEEQPTKGTKEVNAKTRKSESSVSPYISAAIEKAGIKPEYDAEIKEDKGIQAAMKSLEDAKDKYGEDSAEFRKAERNLKGKLTRMVNAIRNRDDNNDVIEEINKGTASNPSALAKENTSASVLREEGSPQLLKAIAENADVKEFQKQAEIAKKEFGENSEAYKAALKDVERAKNEAKVDSVSQIFLNNLIRGEKGVKKFSKKISKEEKEKDQRTQEWYSRQMAQEIIKAINTKNAAVLKGRLSSKAQMKEGGIISYPGDIGARAAFEMITGIKLPKPDKKLGDFKDEPIPGAIEGLSEEEINELDYEDKFKQRYQKRIEQFIDDFCGEKSDSPQPAQNHQAQVAKQVESPKKDTPAQAQSSTETSSGKKKETKLGETPEYKAYLEREAARKKAEADKKAKADAARAAQLEQSRLRNMQGGNTRILNEQSHKFAEEAMKKTDASKAKTYKLLSEMRPPKEVDNQSANAINDQLAAVSKEIEQLQAELAANEDQRTLKPAQIQEKVGLIEHLRSGLMDVTAQHKLGQGNFTYRKSIDDSGNIKSLEIVSYRKSDGTMEKVNPIESQQEKEQESAKVKKDVPDTQTTSENQGSEKSANRDTSSNSSNGISFGDEERIKGDKEARKSFNAQAEALLKKLNKGKGKSKNKGTATKDEALIEQEELDFSPSEEETDSATVWDEIYEAALSALG